MNKIQQLGLVVAIGAALGGCASKGGMSDRVDTSQVVVEDRTGQNGLQTGTQPLLTPATDSALGAETQGADIDAGQEGNEFQGDPLADPGSLLSTRVIYFEFDSDQVPQETYEVITAHANYLSAHPDVVITMVGHADERGSREYNLALGESRALAVSRIMQAQGASREQMELVSFGEERPAAMGHDEEAWHLNRRTELVYPGF